MKQYNFTQMTVAEIRDILVKKYKFNQNKTDALKGKKNLIAALLRQQQLHGTKDDLRKIEDTETENTKEESQIEESQIEEAPFDVDETPEEAPFDVDEEDSSNEEDLLDNSLDNSLDDSLDIENIDFSDDDEGGDFDVEDNNIEEENDDDRLPQFGSEEWSDYVLSLLTKKEKYNDNPTTDGLRRLVHQLIGPIRCIETTVIEAPNINNNKRATVRVRVIVDAGDCDKIFDGVSDSYHGNTPDPFNLHPTSTAETRSEGRAYKKLLGLRRVHVAEEMSEGTYDSDLHPQSTDKEENIKGSQIQCMSIMCGNTVRGMNINIERLINTFDDVTYRVINNVSYPKAIKMMAKLNKYQQDHTSIPDEIKKYDANWRVNFYKND